MVRVTRKAFHRNAAILFDGGQLRTDPAARQARARFGRGVLKSVPSFKAAFSFADAQEAALMFAEAPKPAPRPSITPGQLMAKVRDDIARCKELGRRQDALLLALHGIKPISGGSFDANAREMQSRRMDDIYNGIDEDAGNSTLTPTFWPRSALSAD